MTSYRGSSDGAIELGPITAHDSIATRFKATWSGSFQSKLLGARKPCRSTLSQFGHIAHAVNRSATTLYIQVPAPNPLKEVL